MYGKTKNGRNTSNLRKKGKIPPIGRKGSCKVKIT